MRAIQFYPMTLKDRLINNLLTDQEGDYQAAEVAFTNYIKTFQDSDFIDDAKFWLAQSMYSQGAYNLALELFEGIQKDYPQSEKIMESILKAAFVILN
ncbi:MAG: hypothetical protein Ct9H300mP6_09630 [Gammaproteobacteria bacterium]|nr:MAG: hypothetical protein Ct9H300mP6_09630 [Gammaproteobacteria bacterium]